MANDRIEELEIIVNKLTTGIPKVTGKKMFGCHALWANGNVFALVWKHGRIGVKLTENSDYEKLMKLSGAEPWKTGPMKMSHWVLVPENFHHESKSLKPWITKAHEQALKALPKEKSTKAKKKN